MAQTGAVQAVIKMILSIPFYNRHTDDNPRPMPDLPTGRGRTLPPLNMDEEKSKTTIKKKKTKPKVQEEDEEEQRSEREY